MEKLKLSKRLQLNMKEYDRLIGLSANTIYKNEKEFRDAWKPIDVLEKKILKDLEKIGVFVDERLLLLFIQKAENRGLLRKDIK